jgi:hypothetical protein
LLGFGHGIGSHSRKVTAARTFKAKIVQTEGLGLVSYVEIVGSNFGLVGVLRPFSKAKTGK